MAENSPGQSVAEAAAAIKEAADAANAEIEIEVEGEGEPEGQPAGEKKPPVAADGAEPAAEGEPEGDGEGEEGAEGELQPRRRGPHRRKSPWKRTANVEAEKARLLEAEVERLRQENAKLSTRASAADQANFDNYASRVSTEFDSARRALIEAQSSGDPERIADATAAMSAKAAEKADVERYRAQQKAQPASPAAEEQRQPQQRQPAAPRATEMPPETRDWMTRNTWFLPNHADYDPDLALEAQAFARKLERKMRAEGRETEIGRSDAYFDAVEKHLASEFPDQFEVPPPQPRMNGGPRSVGAPSRAAPGGPAAPRTAPQKVKLTADERDMAIRMAKSGAITNADGSRLTDEQALVRFARRKLTDQASRRAG